MVKKTGLVITFIILIALSGLNIYLFYGTGDLSYNSIAGRAVGDIANLPLNLSLSLVAFVVQWIILIAIAVGAYLNYNKRRSEESIKGNYSQILKRKAKFETDFDILYKLLKEKKKLRVDAIAKTFEISEDQALEWFKILESNDLVTVEYPAFYKPEARIKEKEEIDGEEKDKKQKGEEKLSKKEKKLSWKERRELRREEKLSRKENKKRKKGELKHKKREDKLSRKGKSSKTKDVSKPEAKKERKPSKTNKKRKK